MTDLEQLSECVEKGQAPRAAELVKALLEAGADPAEVLNAGLISAMTRLGQRFQARQAYVPELLMAARAMLAGMAVLEPVLAGRGVPSQGRVVLGTVKGDIHSIGKNLVGIMLRGSGFQVEDLGVDVPPQRFVEAARSGAQLVCLSALLTTSLPSMQATIQALKQVGLGVKTMVGGAVVTRSYAEEIGADGFAPDAASAAVRARELMAEERNSKSETRNSKE